MSRSNKSARTGDGTSRNLDTVVLGEHRASGVGVASSSHTVTDASQVSQTEECFRGIPPTIKIMSNTTAAECGDDDAGTDQTTLQMCLTGCTLPIVNLLRRLVMSEVPTMAIDSVLIEENDGIVFDEALCHRLGLVPIHAPSSKFDYITDLGKYNAMDTEPSAGQVLMFTLNVIGTTEAPTCVYSRDLQWVPLPGQEALASYDIGVVNKNILIAKLAKGQRIKLKAYAVKGIGLTHAKWSPVSCASYKLATRVKINPASTKRCSDEQISEFISRCPMGVFAQADDGSLLVRDESACTSCRECLRGTTDVGTEPLVVLERDKNEVHMTVESVGQMSAVEVVSTALTLFAAHCAMLREEVKNARIV
eukprot:PhM_4_TR11434/c0_g1_i1/m.23362/K03027/RPC40, POLR1C; DNA-directed RNA polymerases I and III subunit RPAC1